MKEPKFSRICTRPSSDTFSVKPIGEFVKRYLDKSRYSVDPFARNCEWATYRNDINPNTKAKYHLDALVFLNFFVKQQTEISNPVPIDLVILDMPRTARQISECYKALGIPVTQQTTQIGTFYKEIRNTADKLLKPNGVVLSFGWNSVGMGIKRGYEIEEIMLCCHSRSHYDTICMAERKI